LKWISFLEMINLWVVIGIDMVVQLFFFRLSRLLAVPIRRMMKRYDAEDMIELYYEMSKSLEYGNAAKKQ
jgi:hypothetical protein